MYDAGSSMEAIGNMPKNFNVDELIERLIVIEKIEEAENDVKEGRVYSHSEVLNMIEEWKK